MALKVVIKHFSGKIFNPVLEEEVFHNVSLMKKTSGDDGVARIELYDRDGYIRHSVYLENVYEVTVSES